MKFARCGVWLNTEWPPGGGSGVKSGRIIGRLMHAPWRGWWEMNVDMASEMKPIVAELARRHPVFPVATIERLVSRTFEEYRDAKIQTYVPLLVRRAVRAQLLYVDDGTGPIIGPRRGATGAQHL
jgi:hypothetical protein